MVANKKISDQSPEAQEFVSEKLDEMMKQTGVGSPAGRGKKGKSGSAAKGGKKSGARGGGGGDAGGSVEVDRRRLASEEPAISPGDADVPSKPVKQAARKQTFVNGGEAPDKASLSRPLPNKSLPMSTVMQATKKSLALRKLGTGPGTNTVFENGGEVRMTRGRVFHCSSLIRPICCCCCCCCLLLFVANRMFC